MIYSYADSDGIFTGHIFGGPQEEALARLPAGGHIVVGQYDACRQRYDISSGRVVAYQPPAPLADEWQTWAWDADAWRWVSVPTTAALARSARSERDRRLLACDWTQLQDVPASTSQAWEAYRQQLRDISAQSGFPGSIIWPEPPT